LSRGFRLRIVATFAPGVATLDAHNSDRFWLSLLAAILLLAQSFIGSVAMAGMASPAASGSPICSAHRDNHQTPADCPDCCKFGCCCTTARALSPPTPLLAARLAAPRAVALVGSPSTFASHQMPGYRPGNPRAPPLDG
jgi:hypothetical protein